jgi:hypothetical protein
MVARDAIALGDYEGALGALQASRIKIGSVEPAPVRDMAYGVVRGALYLDYHDGATWHTVDVVDTDNRLSFPLTDPNEKPPPRPTTTTSPLGLGVGMGLSGGGSAVMMDLEKLWGRIEYFCRTMNDVNDFNGRPAHQIQGSRPHPTTQGLMDALDETLDRLERHLLDHPHDPVPPPFDAYYVPPPSLSGGSRAMMNQWDHMMKRLRNEIGDIRLNLRYMQLMTSLGRVIPPPAPKPDPKDPKDPKDRNPGPTIEGGADPRPLHVRRPLETKREYDDYLTTPPALRHSGDSRMPVVTVSVLRDLLIEDVMTPLVVLFYMPTCYFCHEAYPLLLPHGGVAVDASTEEKRKAIDDAKLPGVRAKDLTLFPRIYMMSSTHAILFDQPRGASTIANWVDATRTSLAHQKEQDLELADFMGSPDQYL